MTNTAYPTSVTHGSPADTDPVPNKVGTQFTVSAPVTIAGVYVWSHIDQPTGGTVELWAEATMLLEKVAALVIGDNFIEFDTPQALTTGVNYQVAWAKATNAPFGYSAASGAFASEIDEAPFIFPATAGRFTNGAGAAHYMNETTPAYLGVSPFTASAPAMTVTATSPVAAVAGTLANLTAVPHDPAGEVAWDWTQLSGATQALTGANTATPSFTPTDAGTFVFRATADDGTTTAHADVSVIATAPPGPTYRLWTRASTDDPWVTIEGGGSSVDRTDGSVFWVEDFGAMGDGTTDDTDAINACLAAAVAAAPDHNFTATIGHRSADYLIAGPNVIGRNFGNSQISIPHIPGSTMRKIILTFRGVSDNAPFLYWAQTGSVKGGTTYRSTLANPTSDANYGTPAVIGGPTFLDDAPQDAMATFSNMLVILDGVQVQVPHYKALGGFNFRRVAQVHVKSASVFSDLTLFTTPSIAEPDSIPNDDSYGLWCPDNGNNARIQVDAFTAEGVSIVVVGGEHFAATFLGGVYCKYGLGVAGNSGTKADGSKWPKAHSYWVGHMLMEGVNHWVYSRGGAAQVVIDVLDGEGVVNFDDHILDASNELFGRVNINDINQEVPVVVGGANLRVISDSQQLGARTAPAVPSSGTPLKNPYWRDATVVVTAGGATITKIEVDGTDRKVTAGQVEVATGASIKLTYTGSGLSWTWELK